MKSIAKHNSIGLVGGVISLAGLCIGIFTLRKKSAPVVRRTSQAPRLPEPVEAAAYDVEEQESSKISEPEPVEIHSALPEPAVDFVPGSRTQAENIAELYRSGKSNLEIARALGISLGEVQLTVKLRGLNAIGAAASGQNNG